jgi:BphX-like
LAKAQFKPASHPFASRAVDVAALRVSFVDRRGAMTRLKLWMRAVGALYLLVFVAAALIKAPISAEGPPGVLALAAAGDATARFVVDTWVTLGLEMGAVGVALLIAARLSNQVEALVWTVCGMEVAGMIADVYQLMRGYDPKAPVTWLVIHTIVIGTGLICLRGARSPAIAPA